MKKTVRFGIIGCGTLAPTHAESINRIKGSRLVAVADIDSQRAMDFGSKYGAKRSYTDYRQLLDNAEIDAVSICAPHHLHAQMAIDAAKAKKHVLVEKPMAINLDQADMMIEACEKAEVKLGAIFQHRFDPAARRVKNTLEKEGLGKVVLASAYVRWHRTEEYYQAQRWRGQWSTAGGGALINQAIHMVDLLCWFMDGVKAVSAFMGTLTHQVEVEDNLVAILNFSNGAMGTIEASTSSYPQTPERLEISGSEGTIAISEGKTVRWDLARDIDLGRDRLGALEAIEAEVDSRFIGKGYYGNSHPKQVEDFVKAIQEGREPFITGKDARKTLEVIFAIYRSADRGKQEVLSG
jgi:predicted dehydrogenase